MTTNKNPKKFYAILVADASGDFDHSYIAGPWRTLKEAKRASYPQAGEKVVKVKVEVVKPPKRKRA